MVTMLPKPSLTRCCYSCVILLCTALYITAMLNSVFEEDSAVLPSQSLQQSPACRPAVVQPSPHKHEWAQEGLQVREALLITVQLEFRYCSKVRPVR